jgi:hypothetical protein
MVIKYNKGGKNIKNSNGTLQIVIIVGIIMVFISGFLIFNNSENFSNIVDKENDYSSILIAERTLEEKLISVRVSLKQERGELLKIKNEKEDLKESYIYNYFNNLTTRVRDYNSKISSLNVVKYKKAEQKDFINKLDKIEQSLRYYITKKDIQQQEFTDLIQDIIGQINNL